MLARLTFSLAVILSLLQAAAATAQKPPMKESPGAQKEAAQKEASQKEALNKARQIAITPEREAAVTNFVDRNHPELAALLSHLKSKQPKEYDRAVRDLYRVTEKLAMVSERDSRQYDLELKVWKAQSRAQLLVARLKMTDPESADREEITSQLREVLSEQMQARLEVMKLDRERVTTRLEKLNDEIGRLERDRESVIDGHLKNLTSQVNSGVKARPPVKEPTDKKPPEKKPGERKPPNKP
jgi:hypothetical protein